MINHPIVQIVNWVASKVFGYNTGFYDAIRADYKKLQEILEMRLKEIDRLTDELLTEKLKNNRISKNRDIWIISFSSVKNKKPKAKIGLYLVFSDKKDEAIKIFKTYVLETFDYLVIDSEIEIKQVFNLDDKNIISTGLTYKIIYSD